MRKILALTAFMFSVQILCGQLLTADKLFSALTIQASKFDEWAAKKKFFPAGSSRLSDTLVKLYEYRPASKKNKPGDSVKRFIQSAESKENFTLTYQTSSGDEFTGLIAELKKSGFYSNRHDDPVKTKLLFQHKNLTAVTFTEIKDSILLYSLTFHEQNFPDAKDLHYADDLLYFTSHEYLIYYFGEENVKKDFYYFSGDDLASCSVLFINTARQVVFIWKDETNKTTIASLLFGGQQKLKSALQSGNFVAESNWVLKSGLHAGMPLYELRVLNGEDVKFYGGGSLNAGMVLSQNSGKINFNKEQVVLGCVNCSDGRFASSEIMNADDALADGKILFVLSVALKPDAINHTASSKSKKPSMVNN